MIKSMTGFGKAAGEIRNKTISIELRSLNSKILDLNMRLPLTYRSREIELRADISKKIERGKAELVISTESPEDEKSYSINKSLAKTYFDELKSLDFIPEASPETYLGMLLRMPDIYSAEKQESDDIEWQQIFLLIKQAFERFDEYRKSEGAGLEIDLKKRVSQINSGMKEIEKLAGGRLKAVREKIKKSLDEFITEENIDKNRFEQELIYYIEKMDITEELVRLKIHCDYFLEIMAEPLSNGRKLNFISQEIGREINTIGSKANDVNIQKAVVQMKDELEKIKEQLLNVL